jgi:hypothetical protein
VISAACDGRRHLLGEVLGMAASSCNTLRKKFGTRNCRCFAGTIAGGALGFVAFDYGSRSFDETKESNLFLVSDAIMPNETSNNRD